jgi:hypothetical protein
MTFTEFEKKNKNVTETIANYTGKYYITGVDKKACLVFQQQDFSEHI